MPTVVDEVLHTPRTHKNVLRFIMLPQDGCFNQDRKKSNAEQFSKGTMLKSFFDNCIKGDSSISHQSQLSQQWPRSRTFIHAKRASRHTVNMQTKLTSYGFVR
jgi:hypothetical protein